MVSLPQTVEEKKRSITSLEDDFRLKNFNSLAFKRGGENHVSFFDWFLGKVLHIVLYIWKNVITNHKNHNNFVIALYFHTLVRATACLRSLRVR